MKLPALSAPRFNGVFHSKPEKPAITIPFDFGGQTYWTTGPDLIAVAEANIDVFQSGLLTFTPEGKPRFIDIIGDHQDALVERQGVFKQLSDKAQ